MIKKLKLNILIGCPHTHDSLFTNLETIKISLNSLGNRKNQCAKMKHLFFTVELIECNL